MSSSDDDVDVVPVVAPSILTNDTARMMHHNELNPAFMSQQSIFGKSILGHLYPKSKSSGKAKPLVKKQKGEQVPTKDATYFYSLILEKYESNLLAEQNDIAKPSTELEIPYEDRDYYSSGEDARCQMIKILRNYFSDPTTKVSAANHLLTAQRRYQRKYNDPNFATSFAGWNMLARKTQFVYCGRCMQVTPDPEGFHYVIIAEVEVTEKEVTGDGLDQCRAKLKVTKLYPHCWECTTPRFERRYWRDVDPELGGRKFNLLEKGVFPQDEICRDVFDTACNVLSSHETDTYHPGNIINNHIGGGEGDYPYDNRSYVDLLEITDEQKTFFGWDSDYADKIIGFLWRYRVWFANRFDLVHELFGSLHHPLNSSALPLHRRDNEEQDENFSFFFSNPSIVWGGTVQKLYKGETALHQPFHCDIGQTLKDPNVENGEYWGIEKNERLIGKKKPMVMIIALGEQSTRDIIVSEHSVSPGTISVRHNQPLIMRGDTTHAGAVYLDDNPRPSIHIPIMSVNHDYDLDDFEIDSQAIVYSQKEHISRFSSMYLKKEIENMREKLYSVLFSQEDLGEACDDLLLREICVTRESCNLKLMQMLGVDSVDELNSKLLERKIISAKSDFEVNSCSEVEENNNEGHAINEPIENSIIDAAETIANTSNDSVVGSDNVTQNEQSINNAGNGGQESEVVAAMEE